MSKTAFMAPVLACALGVASCQQPRTLTIADSRPVAPGRIISLPTPPLAETAATVTVFRNHSYEGSGQSLILGADGHDLAELRNGETFTFYLAPGNHVLSVVAQPPQGTRAQGLSISLEPRAEKLYVVSVRMDGAVIEESAR